MRMLNINAKVELCNKVLGNYDFIMDVIKSIENNSNNLGNIKKLQMLPYNHLDNNGKLPQVRMFETFDCSNVADLIHTIPIFLYEKKPKKRQIEVHSSIDPLGAYITSPSISEPYIELYVDEIHKSDKDKFKELFTLVLLHELGHAALDINNCSTYATPFDEYTYVEDKNREEGMANAIAYHIIKGYTKDASIAKYAKTFISKQGEGYKEGIKYAKSLDDNIRDFVNWKIETIENKGKNK